MSSVDQARRRGFFPLVMALERLAGGPGVGEAASPAEEAIRFRHDPSLAFSVSDVSAVREVALPDGPGGESRRGFEVTTTFLGLTGGVTPLPHFMAEEIAQEDADAPRMRDFLDLFHHRLLSLLYRGTVKYDVASTRRVGESDRWVGRMLALLGVDVSPGETQPPLPAWRLLRLAPLLAEPTITATALEAAVADVVAAALDGREVPVHVEPFAGSWVGIAPDEVTRLGRQACRLGRDCLLGQRVVDPAGRFRVVVGPLGAEEYRHLAGSDVARRVEEVVSALVREPLDHDVVFALAEDVAEPLRLGTSRVGRTTWLGSQRHAARIRADRAA